VKRAVRVFARERVGGWAGGVGGGGVYARESMRIVTYFQLNGLSSIGAYCYLLTNIAYRYLLTNIAYRYLLTDAPAGGST